MSVMDQAGHALLTANLIYARNATGTDDPNKKTRPPVYKAVGISLAIASGVFIGISFVLKKVGLLKANVKYDEVAGEGYGYLKNAFWWGGMTLMIIGEICNFVAYAFVDAILVTPMGALSVVITTILSAIFLKERLSMVGKVGCFLCVIGSVVIVMNAPSESSVATIQEMQHFVIAPGFLTYAGVVIIACVFIALWAGPRYGKKSMLVYLSICSLIGGLSVVATQGLGSAIVAQVGGTKQFNQWFLYVLFVFVITTLVTEIIYLNKALNLFNAALVTPTYYVFFTSSTIITSAILFRGFKGTPTSIVTVVMGFFVICAGVVLLQLSKSAKDVPDTAVFSGDLDQMRTIAEQEQPESEPKADAIRGAAAIVRRFSTARLKMEEREAKRLHDEKMQDLQPIGENEHIEWDGLRRRRTTVGTPSVRSRGGSTPFPPFEGTMQPPTPHPPLGMSRFPDPEDESDQDEERPNTGVSLFTRAKSIMITSHQRKSIGGQHDVQSPMHPVPLTEISLPSYRSQTDGSTYDPSSHYNLPSDQKTAYEGAASRHITIPADPVSRRQTSSSSTPSFLQPGPTPPPHSARRQFSFQNILRRDRGPSQTSQESALQQTEPQSQSRAPMLRKGMRRLSHNAPTKGATEEERLGLVKGDTQTGRVPHLLPDYVEDDSEEEDWRAEDKLRMGQGRSDSELSTRRDRDLMGRREKEVELGGGEDGGEDDTDDGDGEDDREEEDKEYERQRRDWVSSGKHPQGKPPPPPPDEDKPGGRGTGMGGRGGGGAFI